MKLLRDHPDRVRDSQRARGGDPGHVDAVLAADDARRSALSAFEALRSEQKTFGRKVAAASGEEKQQLLAEVKTLATQVKEADAKAGAAQADFDRALLCLDNVIADGVPAGGEDDSVVIKTVGQQRDFAAEGFEPKDHVDLLEGIGGLDLARGAKVSGSRFHFYTGQGAILQMALINYAMAQGIGWGLDPVVPPTLVRPDVMQGTGFLGEHASEVYHLPADDLYLVGTSEVALAGYYADEIIDLSAGPRRFVGVSTCYRREAGAHGKDTRGIIRVHQFTKAEMFVYCDPAQAEAEHQQLLAWEEHMLGSLGLAYQVLDIAAGDLGSSAARKFDCEAWIPTQERYRELTSTSNCTTFQARRLNTRYRTESGTQPVATLNGTLATDRWVAAIVETHQRPDGSIAIPEPLRPYCMGKERLTPTM